MCIKGSEKKKKETATYHLCVILIPIKRAPFLHIHTLFLTHLVTCIIIIIIFYAPHCYIYFIYEWWNEMRVFIFYSNAFFYVIYYGNGSGLCILSQRWLICLFFFAAGVKVSTWSIGFFSLFRKNFFFFVFGDVRLKSDEHRCVCVFSVFELKHSARAKV